MHNFMKWDLMDSSISNHRKHGNAHGHRSVSLYLTPQKNHSFLKKKQTRQNEMWPRDAYFEKVMAEK